MISLEDCIGLCGLTEEEVLAIAEHEHLPEMAAAAYAQYLLSMAHGTEKIRTMIIDDIRHAQLVGDLQHQALGEAGSVRDDGRGIAGEGALGEGVDDLDRNASHGGLLPWARA